MYNNDDGADVFEVLTLNRELREPLTALFQNFGKCVRWWEYYPQFPVRAHHNPKNLKDIVYLNLDGKKHRIYGPAYISKLLDIEAWYKDGKLHRVDGGPAYRHRDNMVWFKDGELHNLNGPAVITPAGPLQFWIDGVRFSKKQYYWEISRRTRKK